MVDRTRLDALFALEQQSFTSDIGLVCPHCRHLHRDADEYFGHSGADGTEVDCDRCGEAFYAGRTVSVSYTTSPIQTPG